MTFFCKKKKDFKRRFLKYGNAGKTRCSVLTSEYKFIGCIQDHKLEAFKNDYCPTHAHTHTHTRTRPRAYACGRTLAARSSRQSILGGGLSLQTVSSEERLRCAPFLTVRGHTVLVEVSPSHVSQSRQCDAVCREIPVLVEVELLGGRVFPVCFGGQHTGILVLF